MAEAPSQALELSPRAAQRRRYLLVGAGIILAVVVAAKISSCTISRDRARTIARVAELEDALARYSLDNSGSVPSTVQGLKALIVKPQTKPIPPNWHGPYLSSEEYLNDGWGRPFQYVAPGGDEPDIPGVVRIPRAYDLWSLGADGREGGTGMNAGIRSWEAHNPAP